MESEEEEEKKSTWVLKEEDHSTVVHKEETRSTEVHHQEGESSTKVQSSQEQDTRVLSKTPSKMSRAFIEPPDFISDEKSYAEYKADLSIWSRIVETSLEKKLQAEFVVYRLEGHPSRIKEKIMTQIGDSLKDNADGINELIKFLDTIYTKDTMADAWDKFSEFNSFVKKPDQAMEIFIAEWMNRYHKAKKVGCEYSDMILAFKLLKDSKLNEMDTKLVLTGVDYEKGKRDKDLCQQIQDSLKKFKGRAIILEEQRKVTAIDGMEEVLIAKGWKPPPKQRRRSRSMSPPRQKSNYKGRKNPLEKVGDNYIPRKCWKCRCNHTVSCNCPCVYHYAPDCTENKKSQEKGSKADLGLFMEASVKPLLEKKEDEKVLVVDESIEELALVTSEEADALVDCACPTTVSGKRWIEEFCKNLEAIYKSMVKRFDSEKMYKFGGGEKRKSLEKIVFPCQLAGKNVLIETEVVEADFPLLLGNSLLKKVDAVLYISREKAVIMGCEVRMQETSSGHFSIRVEHPKSSMEFSLIDTCLITDSISAVKDKELTRKEVEKLHHYFGFIRYVFDFLSI